MPISRALIGHAAARFAHAIRVGTIADVSSCHAIGLARDWFTTYTNQTSATISNNERHEIIFEANNLSAVPVALPDTATYCEREIRE